jgi:hypothetical protein
MNAAQLAFYLAIGLAGIAFIFGALRAARRSTTVRWLHRDQFGCASVRRHRDERSAARAER